MSEPVDYVNERYTTGGEGPEGQPDTVREAVPETASEPEVPQEAEQVDPEPAAEPEPAEGSEQG